MKQLPSEMKLAQSVMQAFLDSRPLQLPPATLQETEWLYREGLRGVYSSIALRSGGLETLRKQFLEEVAQQANWLQILKELGATFESLGLSGLVFKGASSIQRLYGGLGVRPLSDIDLLVLPAEFQAVRSALQTLGFKPWMDFEHMLARDGWIVDIHTNPLGRLQLAFPFDLPAAWNRSVPCLCGIPHLRMFGLIDELIVCILHSTKHSVCRLIWVLDFQLLLRQVPLEEALASIRACRAQRCFYYLLWLSAKLLGRTQEPPIQEPFEVRLNYVERRFLEGVLAREAPETLGLLVPIFSAKPLDFLHLLRAELYPKESNFTTRTRTLKNLLATVLRFFTGSSIGPYPANPAGLAPKKRKRP